MVLEDTALIDIKTKKTLNSFKAKTNLLLNVAGFSLIAVLNSSFALSNS